MSRQQVIACVLFLFDSIDFDKSNNDDNNVSDESKNDDIVQYVWNQITHVITFVRYSSACYKDKLPIYVLSF